VNPDPPRSFRQVARYDREVGCGTGAMALRSPPKSRKVLPSGSKEAEAATKIARTWPARDVSASVTVDDAEIGIEGLLRCLWVSASVLGTEVDPWAHEAIVRGSHDGLALADSERPALVRIWNLRGRFDIRRGFLTEHLRFLAA